MKTYSLSPEAIERLKGKIMTRVFPVMAAAVGFGLFFAFRNLHWDRTTGIVIACGIVLCFGIGLWVLKKQTPGSLASYQLVVTPEAITRKQKGLDDVQIRREEVIAIVESAWMGGLRIRTADRFREIIVMKDVDGYEELRMLLRSWKEPTSASELRASQVVGVAGMLLYFAAHYAKDFIRDERLAAALRIVAALTLLWTFYEVQKSSHVDKKTKRWSWVWLFPTISELLRAFPLLRWP